MNNKFKTVFTPNSNEAIVPKSAIAIGILLIYMATVFVPNASGLSQNAVIGYAIVMTIQLIVFWFSGTIFKNKYWIYFVLQGIITFDYVVIAPQGYKTIFLGLIPIFIMQSMIVYSDAIKVITTAVSFYCIYFGTMLIFSGVNELVESIPLLIIITIAMRAYSIIFFKQVKLRIRSQKTSQELALAYEKVEELTLINERQRMARDLHDTLSQGLAGVIMQLEAVNANLNKNNIERAHEIVQKSMEHARKTLADSRVVIDDLRSQATTGMDFTKTLEMEIVHFRFVSDTDIKVDIRIETAIPARAAKHILYIVREALNNIVKHANAKNAVVEIIEYDNQININVSDDGMGFDIRLLDKRGGHYGILGMTERVKAINGKIKIKSKRKIGTNINIIVPIEKGINEFNE